MSMNTLALLNGLRFIDSFFPSGGFAFSSGLEAAVQDGAVRNAEEVSRYVSDFLRTGIGPCDAVAVGIVHRAAASGLLVSVIEADRELDAMKTGRESREASRQMGRQVIRLAADMAAGPAIIRDYGASVQASRSPGHLAVSVGLTLAALGWSREEAIAAFLYHSATGLISAAVRLLPIGQREAQHVLDGWLPTIGVLSREAESRTELTSWAPVHTIYQMRHSRLTTRLFRS